MTLPEFPLPPVDLSTTLPETVLFHERHNPDVPLFILAQQGSKAPPCVTYGQFARACRQVPRLLGISKEDAATQPVIAILANTDTLIYHTIVLGIMLIGAIPFPISPRNTAEAVSHLISTSSSQRLVLTAKTLPKLATDVIQDLSTHEISWSSRICESPVLSQLYPELVTGSNARNDTRIEDDGASFSKPNLATTCIYLHSSGSTGLPKAIPLNHYEIITYMTYPSATVFRTESPRIQMACMELPPFHGMAVTFQICVPLFHGASASILFPTVVTADDLPTMADPERVINAIESTSANTCFTIPAYLTTWVHNERHVETLRNLAFVEYGGGALPTGVGNELHKKGVRLRSLYGGTEFGSAAMGTIRPGDEEEWEYLEVAKEAHPHFAPQGDGTFELQFICPDEYPRSVTNIPGVNGYATSDLMKPHPTKKHLWKLAGRIDDVVVHSSGEKTVPAPIEFIIQGSPYVSGAIVFGVGRMQPGVIIEPREDHSIDVQDPVQVSALRDLIWPAVEVANKVAPAFSKIYKEMILFTSREKPLPRTPKMTMMKKAAWALYAKEIDDIYTNSENATTSVSSPPAWTEAEVSQWLLGEIHDLGLDKNINPADNLFESGFDSLGAAMLRQRIIRALQPHSEVKEELVQAASSLTLVYKYPSISELAKYLTNVEDGTASTAFPSNSPVEEIEKMIANYTFASDSTPLSQKEQKFGRARVVLITGSTGGLGSHVLERLLQDPSVEKVYTLNRPDSRSTIADRHKYRFKERGLDERLLLSPKLVHIDSHAEDPNLGLAESVYEEIKSSIDLIVHIAWKMDFNQSLKSFESNIRATHHLATLARSSPKAGSIRYVFTSSVGVAQSWDQSLGLYPENLVMDTKYSVGGGYGEAKYVCERILATSGLDTVSVRIGQITGSDANGAWATSDWVPIIFQSSVALGALPTVQGNISWMSADTVASTVVDIVRFDKSLPPTLNVTHPNPITWETMVQHVQGILKAECSISLPVVPFQKWFASLVEASATIKDAANASQIPAIKLIDFFQSLSQGDLQDHTSRTSESFSQPVFETGGCRSISKTLADVLPLSNDEVYNWVRYWDRKQLFAQGK